MKQSNPTNQTLDLIGKRLLDAACFTDSEIDSISRRSDLFVGVAKRVQVEEARRSVSKERRGWSIAWSPVFGVAATALVLITATAFLLISQGSTETQQAIMSQGPASVGLLANKIGGEAKVADPAVRRPATVPAKSMTKALRRQYVEPEMGDFIALTIDDADDDDLRMIRVELPRSSLVAMGVNVHLENEPEKVKADLLIGVDGVPRAVRLKK